MRFITIFVFASVLTSFSACTTSAPKKDGSDRTERPFFFHGGRLDR